MTMEREHKRVKSGEELSRLRSIAQASFQNLDSTLTALQNLKTTLNADGDFDAADVARIDAAITFINGKYTP